MPDMKTGPLWLWILAALALLAVLSLLFTGNPEHRHLSRWVVTINDGSIIAVIVVAAVLHRFTCWAFRK
jgi:bacteriorhodopsin